jgi:hypothetical protein
MRVLVKWLLLAAVFYALWLLAAGLCAVARAVHRLDTTAYATPMPGGLVVLTALALAFTWVKVLRWLPAHKPFKCLKCMTGWSALGLAFALGTPFWWAYLFIGLFTGALVDHLINKYL